MSAAERARGRAGVRCGWWVCMDDVGPEYSTWTWLSPAGQGTYGWLRISAGPGQEAWHVGRGARGMGLESTKITLYDVDIHLTTGIDRVLACAHFPDVTRSRGPCSEARTVGGVGRCIVAPGICARRQMRDRL